jgi:thiamine-monophosphate kinase
MTVANNSGGSSLGEFALIDEFFRSLGVRRGDVVLGIGDDGAVLTPPPGMQLVAVADTLVEGRHFPAGSPPQSIGHRALAVNLSDIAAMGAEPAWALLAITLPRADAGWLSGFARGFGALAQAAGVALVGGDTTAGPLTVSVTVLGFVPDAAALRRSGASPGDALFVSGTPGDAACGLELEMAAAASAAAGGTAANAVAADDAAFSQTTTAALRRRFLYPEPRLALGLALRGIASACIDVSDGLAGDAGKLAAASGCGLQLDVESLPLSAALLAEAGRERAERYALTGGDDYELCFTVSPARLAQFEQQVPATRFACQRIGELTVDSAVVVRRQGQRIELPVTGFDHFR